MRNSMRSANDQLTNRLSSSSFPCNCSFLQQEMISTLGVHNDMQVCLQDINQYMKKRDRSMR